MSVSDFSLCRNALDAMYSRVDYSARPGTETDTLMEECRALRFSGAAPQVGRGKALRHFLENARVTALPEDPFCDCVDTSRNLCELFDEAYHTLFASSEEVKLLSREGAFWAGWDHGHSMPDWENLLRKGVRGIRDEAAEALKRGDLTRTQRDFYLSVYDAYEGFRVLICRLRDAAGRLDSDNARFAAENLAVLAQEPPATLPQAMHLSLLTYAVQNQADQIYLRNMGGLDSLFFPFIKEETEEEIRNYFRYYLFKLNAYRVPANIPFWICGTRFGKDASNALTPLILDAYDSLDVKDPKIHVRVGADTPEPVLRKVLKSIRDGRNSFVFLNDRILSRALVKLGELPADAEHYAPIGCYEPCAAGKELPCTCNSAFSAAKAIEVVLGGGRGLSTGTLLDAECPAPEELDSFEKFSDAVRGVLRRWLNTAMREIIAVEKIYPLLLQAPLLSGTFSDCMERGLDAYSGGVRYGNSSVVVFGLATAVDSLQAIRQLVYREKLVTLRRLGEILAADWQGEEALRSRARSLPKYGTNSPEPDDLAVSLQHFLAQEVNGKANGRGGVFRLGAFSIDWRMGFGKLLSATPDGRLAGEPTSKNMCASVGMDREGVTAMIASATKIDYSEIPDGTVLDLHIHPSAAAGEEGLDVLRSLLRVYLNSGGGALQMNVISPETLRAAQREPEKYRNLQVRLCGWNVYFLDLDTQSQNDLIESMESA